MRVLFVSSGNNFEGISSIIANQANSLTKEGMDISHYTISGKGIIGYLKNTMPLRIVIKGQKFDLIHAHYGISGVIARLSVLLAFMQIPVIVSYMGDDLLGSKDPSGELTFKGVVLQKINLIFAKYLNSWSIVKSAGMAAKIHTVKNHSVIPNGVDLNVFAPGEMIAAREKLKLSITKKIILFPADPKRDEKNYRLAKESVAILNHQDYELLAVFNIPQSELIDYYNASDVIVLSSFHEGSPNVIKEAMACNRPIVATKVGDVETIIKNTEGCYLAKFDIKDFSQKIELAVKFGKSTNGRLNIKHLSSAVVAKEIVELYKKVIRN